MTDTFTKQLLAGMRERAQWWIDNDGDTGTISGRAMRMAHDVIELVYEVERLEAILAGSRRPT